MAKRKKVIAVDFDGTLFEVHKDGWPKIGKPMTNVINALKEQIKKGALVYLWTIRQGKNLRDALKKCEEHKISLYGIIPDKPGVDEFWDDRSYHPDDFWEDGEYHDEHFENRWLEKDKEGEI